MSELRVEALTHTYSAGTPFEKTAIENISLTIPSGQFVGLLGHTGSGKSTFIQHLNALLKPTGGTVYVDGEDINKDKKSRRAVKNKVGLVFQYPEYQLFEETVFADIAFGPKNMGLGKEEIEQRVREAADFVGVEEELFQRSPLELSGGQKRRIAIAGVIAMRPQVLILDEPVAGLDPGTHKDILNMIESIHDRNPENIIILVSHNMNDVARYADKVLVMNKGELAMSGTPSEVFARSEELREMGLDLPDLTVLGEKLNEAGVTVPLDTFTEEEMAEAIFREIGGERA